MNKPKRQYAKENSNNRENPNQNLCALAVAKALSVDKEVRYLHTVSDIVRAARKSWTVRSRKSSFKGTTVGSLRKEIRTKGDAIAYIVFIKGHVLLLSSEGKTIVDTNPKKRDVRKVTHIYGVWA